MFLISGLQSWKPFIKGDTLNKYIIIQHFLLLLDPNQYSWGENYAGSSGLMSISPDMNPMQRARSGTVSLQRKRRETVCEGVMLSQVNFMNAL